jgi:hypothetical protein
MTTALVAWRSAALLVAVIAVAAAAVAEAGDDNRYEALKSRADRVYEAEVERCAPLTGDRKASCIDTADGKRARIEADAEAHRAAAKARLRAQQYQKAAQACRKLDAAAQKACEEKERANYENEK